MMARKRRKPSSVVLLLLGAMVVFGIAVVGMTVLEIPISLSVLQLTLIDTNRNILCDGSDCKMTFIPGGFNGDWTTVGDGQGIAILPLSEIDLNAPIRVGFRIELNTSPPVGCESFVSTNEIMNVNAFSIQPGSTVPMLSTTIQEGDFGFDDRDRQVVLDTDIQPLLTDGQDVLELTPVAGICTIGSNISYRVFNGRCNTPSVTDPTILCTRGDTGAKVKFFKKPPEFNEPSLTREGTIADFGTAIQTIPSNLLLGQNVFLSTSEFEQLETSFAVGEKFQLSNPTVITSIVMELHDPTAFNQPSSAVITGFIWNLDESPPKRIAQSASISGIGGQDSNFKFSFPNAVVLMPGSPTPTNYAVGIRVDGNTGEINYGHSPEQLTAKTHSGIRSITTTANDEGTFEDVGLVGLDIFHDRALAETILALTDGGDVDQPLPDQPPEPLTQSELISILCAGLEPEPQICQGDILTLTINQCGATEVFFDGDCLCAPNYDRNEAGSCQIREVPSLLKIGEFSSEELVVIGVGLLILITGAVGIFALIRR
jgi:hypothetical protein